MDRVVLRGQPGMVASSGSANNTGSSMVVDAVMPGVGFHTNLTTSQGAENPFNDSQISIKAHTRNLSNDV